MPSWIPGGWTEFLLGHGWVIWLILLFLLGSAVGSFLNVCIARLPLEKSLFWPSSRCGRCLMPIRWYDNLPLVSYWLLRGRCRNCGERFSVRYFFIELLTGLGFAGLYYLEVVHNVHHWKLLEDEQLSVRAGVPPWPAVALFFFHAALFSFLLTAAFCDLSHREIPLSLTVTGTIVGLAGSVLFPWPFPYPTEPVLAGGRPAWWHGLPNQRAVFDPRIGPWWNAPLGEGPVQGIYPWPVWGPLPAWLPPGSWQVGLATGLAGLLVGTLLLRAVRFVFSTALGVEALGLGDADLMMMAGSFLGWQPVVVGFFVGCVGPGLLFGLIQYFFRRDNSLPFGPALAVGLVITWLAWDSFGRHVQIVFFWDVMLLGVVVFGVIIMFVLGFALRMLRR